MAVGGRLLGKKKEAVGSEGGGKEGCQEGIMIRVHPIHVSTVRINSLHCDTLQNGEA